MNPGASTYVAVVDDDESFCSSLGRLLRAQGMHAITYLSAEQFLADQKRPEFGCLVLDIRLGGISGLELARRLRGADHHAPFIFVTAHDNDVMRSEAACAGCSAFLRKTDRGDEIIDAIRELTCSPIPRVP